MSLPPVARHQGEAETSTYARASTMQRRLQAVIQTFRDDLPRTARPRGR